MTPPVSGLEVRLRRYPEGLPVADDFECVRAAVPPVGPGQLLVRTRWLSIDPAMRTWSSRSPGRGDPMPLGSVMKAMGVGEIVESRHPDYAVGERVVGYLGLREWHVTDGRDLRRRVSPRVDPLQRSLGILGHIGLTAYAGVHRVLAVEPGQTVLVSSAAGAVGSIAGQLARIHGCRVIGIAAGAQKVQLCLTDYRFDACLDRLEVDDLDAALAEAAPEGIHCYFDNTGGVILDAAMRALQPLGRVAVCGTISISSSNPGDGPRHERRILDRRLTVRGFLQSDFEHESESMLQDLMRWHDSGEVVMAEDITRGLANSPTAVVRQLSGQHLGKVLVGIDTDESSHQFE